MRMSSDFSRTLALLRKEKKISQRVAATDLGVSQALLSHYENGLREPGLSFVVLAARYYHVSCDYLLGCSMCRDGNATPPTPQRTPLSQEQGDADNLHAMRRKLVLNAAALLFEVSEYAGAPALTDAIGDYLSLTIYKVFRYLHAADPTGVEQAFRTDSAQYESLCNAGLHLASLRIATEARGEDIHLPTLAPAELARNFPEVSASMLTVLQNVADQITQLQELQIPQTKPRK